MMSNAKSKSATLINNSDFKFLSYKILYAFIIAILILCSFIAIVPSIWIFMSGFKTTSELFSATPKFFPESIKFSKIAEVWTTMKLGSNILSTFILAFGDILSMLFVCGFGGYVLSRIKPKGHKVLFAIVLWTMMMPVTVRTVPLYMSFVDFPIFHFSLLNSYFPLFLISAGNAFNIMLFKTFFDSIPISLIESGRIEGCSEIGIFIKIVIPLSMPIIAFCSITLFNSVWNDFIMPMLVLNDYRIQPIPVVIYRIKTSANYGMPVVAMALTLASIPPIIAFIIFQKQIMGGINIGGVKG